MINNLEELKLKYSHNLSKDKIKQEIRYIYDKYIKRKQDTILDIISITTALSIEILQERINPQILEAIKLQYPNLDIENFSYYSSEQLQGIVNGVKGKYFEILVRDKLNSGERIGNLLLEENQKAILAESSTQPGWDLQIVDSNGKVIEFLQLKAVDSMAHIKEAIERYPNIDVIATDEVAEKFTNQLSSQIIDSDISDTALESTTKKAIGEISESFLEDFFDHFNPLIPLAIIGITESYRVIIGKYTFQRAIHKSKNRAFKSMASLGVGAMLSTLNFGAAAIPSSVLIRLAIDRQENTYFLSKLLKSHSVSLK